MIEVLEDRVVPSTFTVLNLADSGAGSLRAAVLAAEAHPGPDGIKFGAGVKGTIALTSGEIAITSDLAMTARAPPSSRSAATTPAASSTSAATRPTWRSAT